MNMPVRPLTAAEFQRVRDLAWPRTDRLANPGTASRYQPHDPAPLPPAYLAAVDDYLRRVDDGEPIGRSRLQQMFPTAPCHTGGHGRFACIWCESP